MGDNRTDSDKESQDQKLDRLLEDDMRSSGCPNGVDKRTEEEKKLSADSEKK